jgi:hypothetical protein
MLPQATKSNQVFSEKTLLPQSQPPQMSLALLLHLMPSQPGVESRNNLPMARRLSSSSSSRIPLTMSTSKLTTQRTSGLLPVLMVLLTSEALDSCSLVPLHSLPLQQASSLPLSSSDEA